MTNKSNENSQRKIIKGEGKYQITLERISCGKDVSVCIYGGDVPHIGAVAVAVSRKSLTGDGSASASVSVICIDGHKEDEIARKVALKLSTIWQCSVSVSVGIHIKGAVKDDFIIVENIVDELVDELVDEFVDELLKPLPRSSDSQTEQIICVDAEDREIGPIEKMAAHHSGTLHRAFSILVFNSKDQLLLQRRALTKYHTPGLWTNTCCSHPRYGEVLTDATQRRLIEEMGFTCELKELFGFIYKVEFEQGLFEHEFDHVFIGRYDGEIKPNPEEVDAYKWEDLETIKADIALNPDSYTYWFKHLLPLLETKLQDTHKEF